MNNIFWSFSYTVCGMESAFIPEIIPKALGSLLQPALIARWAQRTPLILGLANVTLLGCSYCFLDPISSSLVFSLKFLKEIIRIGV